MKGYEFTWKQEALTTHENQLVGAILELHMMYVVLYRKQGEGRTNTTLEDASGAINHTVRWAREIFPDLGIAHRLAHV
jgi:hypothetical protein